MEETSKSNKPWQVYVLTIFPEVFPGVLSVSLIGKALQKGIFKITPIDLKKFAKQPSNRLDDKPYGGGAGMVILADVVDKAVNHIKDNDSNFENYTKIFLTPSGRLFKQSYAYKCSKSDGIILLCGRYEGVDQRVIDKHKFDVISMGDFVVSSGEVVGLSLIDSCVRLIDNVIGKQESLTEESFSENFDPNLVEYPHYTRPQVWQNLAVPDVLVSGNHQEVAKWRLNMSKETTKNNRFDLWQKYQKKI